MITFGKKNTLFRRRFFLLLIMTWGTMRLGTEFSFAAPLSPATLPPNSIQLECEPLPNGQPTPDVQLKLKQYLDRKALEIWVKSAKPGEIALDMTGLDAESYTLSLEAPGYTSQRMELNRVSPGNYRPGYASDRHSGGGLIKMCRKRYVTIHYAFNRGQNRDFSRPDTVRTATIGHSQKLPKFGEDWSISQQGTVPYLKFTRISKDGLFGLRPIEKESFEAMRMAPTDGYDCYEVGGVEAVKGRSFYCRVAGNYGGVEGLGYGKLTILDVSDAAPEEPGFSNHPRALSLPPNSIYVECEMTEAEKTSPEVKVWLEPATGGQRVTLWVKSAKPGEIALDMTEFQAESYILGIEASGYAPQKTQLVRKAAGEYRPEAPDPIKLYRKRYVRLRYALTTSPNRDLSHPEIVETVTLGDSESLHGLENFKFLQKTDGIYFSDRMLQVGDSHFDSMNLAPDHGHTDVNLSGEDEKAVKGSSYYFHEHAREIGGEYDLYGKMTILDVSTEVPQAKDAPHQGALWKSHKGLAPRTDAPWEVENILSLSLIVICVGMVLVLAFLDRWRAAKD